ncbi:hypothetical protein HDU97_005797 [Phlyctochytrium planicorne]|nr:hypothetical protein HDU97_005797 [Phlyctochytrium planicorne]
MDVSENGQHIVGVNSNDEATVCDDGAIWGVNSASEIFYSGNADGNWYKVPGLLSNIDCGTPGVFGIGITNGDIWNYNFGNGQWDPIPGSLSQVSSGANGVWGVTPNNEIFQLNGDRNSWTKIDGLLNWVSSGSHGMIWGVTRTDDIFYRVADTIFTRSYF